jgi:hypothetical protein
MFRFYVRLVVIGLAFAMPVRADDLADAASDLCEKVKSCALDEMGSQQLSEEQREMMQPMIETMCESVHEKIAQVTPAHPNYKPAIACMRSMQRLSCRMMQDPQQMTTPECQDYEELLRESEPQS